MKSTAFSKFIFTIACSLFLLIIFLSGNQTQAAASFVLDGLPDTDYAAAITTDPSADLASPGPADWAGTHWSDLTNLYCGHDGTNLFVYASAPSYSQTTSSGQIGLLIDSTATSGTGGSAEPWNNAISFSHSNLPHYIIRGNIPGITDPPNSNNGWTELRSWNGSSWSAGGTNWGGITDPNQVGGHIAYANAQGVEFKIPFSDIG
ncbi:MAG: hypothetical protein KAG66_12755, partial [Methylococcales bacterium]|nr:hypothetical protein [Methylococcales bacterium]